MSGDQGWGLAWLLWQEGGVVNSVVELGVACSLGVYRKDVTEGRHINNGAIKASQSVTWQYAVLKVITQ